MAAAPAGDEATPLLSTPTTPFCTCGELKAEIAAARAGAGIFGIEGTGTDAAGAPFGLDAVPLNRPGRDSKYLRIELSVKGTEMWQNLMTIGYNDKNPGL